MLELGGVPDPVLVESSGVSFKGVLKGFVVSVFSQACVMSGLALVKQWRDGMAVLLWQDGGRECDPTAMRPSASHSLGDV